MKKIAFVITLVISSLILVKNVNAATTSYITAPSLVPEAYRVNDTAHSLKGSSKTAQGSNCKAYFTLHGTISVDLAPWSNRVMTIALWDDDVFSNDRIKIYKGGFTGREFTSISVSETLISGDVEPKNDPTAELFLSFYIQKNSEDRDYVGTGNFFQYKLENA